MKIAILTSRPHNDLLVRLGHFFSSLTIEVVAVVVSADWSLRHRKGLESLLARTDLFLVTADRPSMVSAWMVFLLGYLREEGHRLLLFTRKGMGSLPDWSRGLTVCRNFTDLRRITLSVHEMWEGEITRKLAQRTLEGMGIDQAGYNLINAVKDGDRLLTGLFLESGLSPRICDNRGVPLICLAARRGYQSVIQALLAAGADINQVSEDRGNTPLMDAAAAGHCEVVRYLADRGAELEIRSRNGQTALLLAVGNRKVKTAKELLARGADPSVADNLGMTAVQYARLFREESLLALIDGR